MLKLLWLHPNDVLSQALTNHSRGADGIILLVGGLVVCCFLEGSGENMFLDLVCIYFVSFTI